MAREHGFIVPNPGPVHPDRLQRWRELNDHVRYLIERDRRRERQRRPKAMQIEEQHLYGNPYEADERWLMPEDAEPME